MSVLSISRDWGTEPAIVRMVVTDSLATITTAGYLTGTAIAAEIEALNMGEFDWADSDVILIKYDTNWNFFYRNATTNTFVGLPGPGGISSTLPAAQIIVGSAGNVATAVAMSGDVAITTAGATTIQASAVQKSMLAATVRPSHMIVYAGKPTTVGGAAAEAFAVAGAVAATDNAFVQMVDNGTNNVTVLQAVVTNDTLTVTFSADPGNDAVFNYQIIRATS
jgi:hypothetical protein